MQSRFNSLLSCLRFAEEINNNLKKINIMRKLIILSIVLLTTLSATLIGNFSESTKKQELIPPSIDNTFKKDMEVAKKLKLFNAKDYLRDYEKKKKAKEMLNESMKKDYSF